MRFFTPELFLRFNSADEDEADRADGAWEAALVAYRKHLVGLRDAMPSSVRKLADLHLHDAEWLACDEVVEPLYPIEPHGPNPYWSAVAILSLRQEGDILSLIYLLWDRVREYSPVCDWPFSKRHTHWLYDELDLDPRGPGMFLQRILLSDGRVFEIPFTSVITHTVPIPPAAEDAGVRQSA